MNQPPLVKAPQELQLATTEPIAHKSDYGQLTFASLEDGKQAKPFSRSDLLTALQAAFAGIQHPVQSAWGEHIPLMLSLITLVKPRRYVELGVHNGASFFAACQGVRSCGLTTDCVAIDNWFGDAHAGSYDTDVFNTFVSTLGEFEKFAGYIRSDFSQAVEKFQAGSIDLLHIDGLHTAPAVQSDFDAWLPKMSYSPILGQVSGWFKLLSGPADRFRCC